MEATMKAHIFVFTIVVLGGGGVGQAQWSFGEPGHSRSRQSPNSNHVRGQLEMDDASAGSTYVELLSSHGQPERTRVGIGGSFVFSGVEPGIFELSVVRIGAGT